MLMVHNADSYSHAEGQLSMNIDKMSDLYQVNQLLPPNISSGTACTYIIVSTIADRNRPVAL